MLSPGETEAALRGRSRAEGLSGGLIETMNGARRLRFPVLRKPTSDRQTPMPSKSPPPARNTHQRRALSLHLPMNQHMEVSVPPWK